MSSSEIEPRGDVHPGGIVQGPGGGDSVLVRMLPGEHAYDRHARRVFPVARQPGELDPEWVMVGVDVPAGKRLYASKDLKGSAFELAMDEHFNGDGWHLTTTMQRMLVITKPTYAECLGELMRIWANWENEGRELPAGHGGGERRAIR